MISGVFNVLSDFFILAFPLWAIWHLQMPLKRKFGVSVVFATGVFALLSSIMRLFYTSQLSHNRDKTFIIAKVALWTTAEIATVLLCGSLPILPKLAHYAKESRSSPSKGSTPSYERRLNDDSYRRAQSTSKRSNDSATYGDKDNQGVAKVPRSLA